MDRNKFVKHDYVVTATDKNPAYKYNNKGGFIVLVIIIIALTCINF